MTHIQFLELCGLTRVTDASLEQRARMDCGDLRSQLYLRSRIADVLFSARSHGPDADTREHQVRGGGCGPKSTGSLSDIRQPRTVASYNQTKRGPRKRVAADKGLTFCAEIG